MLTGSKLMVTARVELVDGEKLVTMFERAGIGLRPVLDAAFFDEFKV